MGSYVLRLVLWLPSGWFSATACMQVLQSCTGVSIELAI